MSEAIRASEEARPAAVMRTYLTEVVGGGNLDLIAEFTAPDMVDHTQPSLSGPAALKAHVQLFCGNIPDLQVEVLEIIATADAAVGIWRWHGTPTDPIWGRSASGNPVTPTLIASVFRFRDDMLVEYRPFVDAVDILDQLRDAS